MTDRPVSRRLALSDFPGWELATEDQVDALERFARSVLDPIILRWGPVAVTSWRWWSSGEPRTGAHAEGAVDIVPLSAPIPAVFTWIARELPGRFGELIDERNHLHLTPPGVGGNGETLYEYAEGRYAAVDPWGPPRQALPDGTWYELPGIVATVAGPRTWLAWLILAAVAVGVARA